MTLTIAVLHQEVAIVMAIIVTWFDSYQSALEPLVFCRPEDKDPKSIAAVAEGCGLQASD